MLLRLIGLSSCLALSLAEPTPGADDATPLPTPLAALLATHGGEATEAATDAHDALVALSRRNRHRPPPTLREKPKGVCPPELEATVNATGMLSVDHFRSGNVTCDEATRLAINMTANCGGSVYFPTPCDFASTVVVPGGTSLTGGGGALLLLPLTPGASPADVAHAQLLGATSSRFARRPPSRARPPGLPSSSSTSRTWSSTTSRSWATTPA